mgnify:CR=1 FL=1
MKNTALLAVGISIVLILLVILNHNLAFGKTSTIILPAGGTYLGPTDTTTPAPTEAFVTIRGRIYPYFFQAPTSLKLVTFPKDTYDIYAIAFDNQPPENNVLIGVDDLRKSDALKKYISVSKRKYVENWWKQFGGLKGVASIVEFTNSNGLKGYRAKFLNSANQSPNEDIFFEVKEPWFVIHLASGVLERSVFESLVNSVGWTENK